MRLLWQTSTASVEQKIQFRSNYKTEKKIKIKIFRLVTVWKVSVNAFGTRPDQQNEQLEIQQQLYPPIKFVVHQENNQAERINYDKVFMTFHHIIHLYYLLC